MGRKVIDWYRGLPADQSSPVPVAVSGSHAASDWPAPARPLRPTVPGLFSIAPMIDKTNRHFRRFLRMLTRRAVLYTEMVTSGAILHGRRDLLLDFDAIERPLVLQLGGDNPAELAEAVRIAEDWGYDEYNLNVGCPSDKVQQGRFGACLMADPGRVAEIVAAMATATTKPVTVKHRVGINGFGYHRESYEEMVDFVRTVHAAGCERFIVHARIAMLEGLSPKENRSVPPIRYEDVWRLKAEHPFLPVEVNGQIKTFDDCRTQLSRGMDGIMIGRASYEDPGFIAGLDAFEADWESGGLAASGDDRAPVPAAYDRRALVLAWADYIDQQSAEQGINPRSLIWPVLELFPGVPGSRKFRQILSQPYRDKVCVASLARQALAALPSEIR